MQKLEFVTLDHVQVVIPRGGEDEARRYYCDCLGLVEMEKPDLLKVRGGLWLRAGDRELHLGVQEPFIAAKKAHPAFRVADVRHVAAQLADHGFDVNWDDNIPGVTRFETFDVFGNRLEFLQQEP